MEPLFVAPIQLLCEKRFGKKWKNFISSTYVASSFGRARIELYSSEEKYKKGEPQKLLLLDNCISIRTLEMEKGVPVLRLNMNDNSIVTVTCSQLVKLREVVSHAAFPSKKVTIQASSSSTDSMDANQGVIDAVAEPLIEQVPVLLLSTTMSRSKKVADGNYDLDFSETLFLKIGDKKISSVDYTKIIWVATGEHCCGFEVEESGILEFKCSQPSLIMDNFRRHMKFSTDFTPISKKTQNAYNRTYNALKTPATILNSTIEEHEDEMLANDSRSSTARTKDSGISTDDLGTIASFSSSRPPAISKSLVSLTESNTLSINTKEKKEGSKFFSFFRRNSSKRKEKTTPKRGDFEEDANCEWTRVSPRQPPVESNPIVENAMKFKEELEAMVAKKRAQQDLITDRPSLSEELERQFAHLSANDRGSVACSEPANSRY